MYEPKHRSDQGVTMPAVLDNPTQPTPGTKPAPETGAVPPRSLTLQRLRAEKLARYSLLLRLLLTGLGGIGNGIG